MPPFRFPCFYNPYYYNKFNIYPQYKPSDKNNQTNNFNEDTENKKTNNSQSNTIDYFFELFGLKLYFDDVLLICLIFFLYQEGVKDDELFLSLILLLLS